MGRTKRAARWLLTGTAVVALAGAAVGCDDDGPSVADVSDNFVQACADVLGLDPDDFSEFSDVDDFDEITDAVSDNTDAFDDFTDELSEEFDDDLTDYLTDLDDEFSDQFTDLEDATDADEQQEILEQITDDDAFADLLGPFEGCGELIRTLVLGGIASQLTDEFTDFTDFTDQTGNRPPADTGDNGDNGDR